ncbi:MAG: hypothetical protein IJ875_04795, partial [Solobacterium sp.]|nr:hypothetical protein [Solobacterium sp.]
YHNEAIKDSYFHRTHIHFSKIYLDNQTIVFNFQTFSSKLLVFFIVIFCYHNSLQQFLSISEERTYIPYAT